MLPHAICNDPRRQRIPRVCQPLGKLQPAASRRIDGCGARYSEGSQKSSRDNRTKAFGFSANANCSVGGVFRFHDGMHSVAARAGIGQEKKFGFHTLVLEAIGLLLGLTVRSYCQAFRRASNVAARARLARYELRSISSVS